MAFQLHQPVTPGEMIMVRMKLGIVILMLFSFSLAYAAKTCNESFLSAKMTVTEAKPQLVFQTRPTPTIEKLSAESLQIVRLLLNSSRAGYVEYWSGLRLMRESLIKKRIWGPSVQAQRIELSDPKRFLIALSKDKRYSQFSEELIHRLQFAEDLFLWVGDSCKDDFARDLIKPWIREHLLLTHYDHNLNKEVFSYVKDWKSGFIQILTKVVNHAPLTGLKLSKLLDDSVNIGEHHRWNGRFEVSEATVMLNRLLPLSNAQSWSYNANHRTAPDYAERQKYLSQKVEENSIDRGYRIYLHLGSEVAHERYAIEKAYLTGDLSSVRELINHYENIFKILKPLYSKDGSLIKIDSSIVHYKNFLFELISGYYRLMDFVIDYQLSTNSETTLKARKIKEGSKMSVALPTENIALFLIDAPKEYESKALQSPALTRDELVGLNPQAETTNLTVEKLERTRLEFTATQSASDEFLEFQQQKSMVLYDQIKAFNSHLLNVKGLIVDVNLATIQIQDFEQRLLKLRGVFDYMSLFLTELKAKNEAYADNFAEIEKSLNIKSILSTGDSSAIMGQLERLEQTLRDNKFGIPKQITVCMIELTNLQLNLSLMASLREAIIRLNPNQILKSIKDFETQSKS